jgi:CheY-specific phosphatase CheX
MNEINSVDLKGLVINAVNNVFDMMLSLKVEISDADPQVVIKGNRIVGSVGFAGDVMGNIRIVVGDDFACLMTAAMLGMELEEVDGEEVNDVIGELSNMIGGDLKSRLCDSGFPCKLSIPCVTSGSDFKIESRGWIKHESFIFCHQQHNAMVEVFIKSGG